MVSSAARSFFWSVFLLLSLGISTSQAAPRQLVILTWPDYLDPALVARFEQQYDAKVDEVFFSSDDKRTEILLANGGIGYDLILVSGIVLDAYAKRGWLTQIEHERAPNLQHLDPRWLNAFEGTAEYGVPYFWGTTGIIYRRDLVTTPITRWQQLFQPAPELQGKIAMVDTSADMIGMALKSLGYSANSKNKEQLAEAETLLLEQKPYVGTYQYPPLDERSPLLTGNIVAAMIYSGDALKLQEHNAQLKYVTPEEGSSIWADYFTLGAQSREPELAYAFLDFINEPSHAAQQAQFVYYATPNTAAKALLPEEFLQHPIIYPDPASLDHSEFYHRQPATAMRQRNHISARVLQ